MILVYFHCIYYTDAKNHSKNTEVSAQLMEKVTGTSCEYFNPTMFNLMDKARVMEDKVGESKDPATLTADPDYSKYGPITLCLSICEDCHMNCRHLSGWPALATQMPAANNAESNKGPTTGSTLGSVTGSTSTDTSSTVSLSAKQWRYIWPHNLSQTVAVDSMKFIFASSASAERLKRLASTH